jgi:hypothetical protein
MASARLLTLSRNSDPALATWENDVIYATIEDYAILHDKFYFFGTKGATYDIISSSFFDPFILEVFDSAGNAIAVDDGQLDYGFDHAAFKAPYSGIYYIAASWNQGVASANKAVGIGIFEDLDTIPPRIQNVIQGTTANDRLFATPDNDIVNGGAGLDTFVLQGNRARYTVVNKGGTLTISDKVDIGAVDTLQGVERLSFADTILSFETSGAAAQSYRLYKAAFDRAPDAVGLGYWINAIEHGTSLSSVASFFTSSAEFASLYGSAPTASQVLTALYHNVLHRVPDQGGFDFWMGALNSKSTTVVDMLISFSESAENQAQVIGSLNAGFEFTY